MKPATSKPTTLPTTDRTRVRRLAERQHFDRAELYDILDSALVAHVATIRDGLPLVLPLGIGRRGDELLFHGSTGAGMLRLLAEGAPVSACVTHVDGLAFARSINDSSMNYRSAVIFGIPRLLSEEEKFSALEAISEHLMPGRWQEARIPSKKELAATAVLSLSLDEVSVKVRAYSASESPDDGEDRAIWAGIVPLSLVAGEPQPSPLTPGEVDPPPSINTSIQRFPKI
jgi:nitroimidazol reductase NimA-like FMN-containing flavoprotein (pyridoxamine 5'-phosphate oxidase superfamily)